MSRLINIDDSRNCYIGMDGEYETWNIDPNVIAEAQPQRKTGKWIGYNTEQDGWKRTDGSPVFMSCSECNGLVLNNGSAHWNFCPNCGSYNGGDKDDQR